MLKKIIAAFVEEDVDISIFEGRLRRKGGEITAKDFTDIVQEMSNDFLTLSNAGMDLDEQKFIKDNQSSEMIIMLRI